MVLTNEQIEILSRFADEENAEFRMNYSGRFMFGKKCVGFVVRRTIVFAMKLQSLIDKEFPSLAVHFKESAQDNMGKDYILYFPKISIQE